MGNRRAACLSRPSGADRVGIGSQDGVTERGERPAKVACLSAWQRPRLGRKRKRLSRDAPVGWPGSGMRTRLPRLSISDSDD